MKIKKSSFPIENEVLYAQNDSIVFNTKKNKLEETWDGLADYYSKKIEEANKEIIADHLQYKKILLAKVEIETGKKQYELMRQNVLKGFKCMNIKNNTKNESLKFFILNECVSIIDKSFEMLSEAYQHEETVWRIIKDNKKDKKKNLKIVDGVPRIYLDDYHFVIINNEGKCKYPKEWKSKGLTCIVEYESLKIEGCILEEEDENELKNLENFLLEKKLIKNYEIGKLKISIIEGTCKVTGELSVFILKSLKMGIDIKELGGLTILYLSRTLLKYFIESLEWKMNEIVFINYNENIMLDKLSETFFCVSKNEKIKVIRKCEKGLVEIYLNEKRIFFQSIL